MIQILIYKPGAPYVPSSTRVYRWDVMAIRAKAKCVLTVGQIQKILDQRSGWSLLVELLIYQDLCCKIDRQTDRQAGRHTGSQREREREREGERGGRRREREREGEEEGERETERGRRRRERERNQEQIGNRAPGCVVGRQGC